MNATGTVEFREFREGPFDSFGNYEFLVTQLKVELYRDFGDEMTVGNVV